MLEANSKAFSAADRTVVLYARAPTDRRNGDAHLGLPPGSILLSDAIAVEPIKAGSSVTQEACTVTPKRPVGEFAFRVGGALSSPRVVGARGRE
jgi:hypothetical protein